MKTLGRYWLAVTLVAAAFATSAALYHGLPATIPIHWNARGVIDGWAPKWEGVLIAPCTGLVIAALLILFGPWREQDGWDAEEEARAHYHPTIVALVAGICCYVNAVVLIAGMGWHLDIPSHVGIGVGLLIAVLGNVLRQVPQNGAVGIRTPWTLGNEAVWARTHRIASWLFMMAGAVMVVTGVMGQGMTPGLVAIGAAAVVSVGYSYVVSRRLGN